MNDTTTGRQAAAILAGLGWPTAIPTERLVASVYDRAMRSGMFEAEVVIGYTFDRTELPAVVSRDDRLTVALHALLRFAADNGRLEALRHDGDSCPTTCCGPTNGLPRRRGCRACAACTGPRAWSGTGPRPGRGPSRKRGTSSARNGYRPRRASRERELRGRAGASTKGKGTCG